MFATYVVNKAVSSCTTGLAVAADCLLFCCRFGLCALLSLLTSVKGIVALGFEWQSRLLSAPACGVYAPQKSAVVIIGGEAGLGQTISLSLSENGYTVFALCPNIPAACTSSEQATKSSAVSSLLYAWHKRKERSTHTSWGLIAPISCDTKSGAQRTHAFETVHAYCTKHSLKLVALLFVSSSSFDRRQAHRHPLPDTETAFGLRSIRPSTFWESTDNLSLMEPILVMEDYASMLAEASGKILLLSHAQRECYLCRPVALLDGLMHQIAKNLSYVLESMGIRVTFVSVGPVGRLNEDEPSEACSRYTMQDTIHPFRLRLHKAISDLLSSCVVERDDFCKDLHAIITTRYPRCSYSVGLYPLLDSLRFAMPDAVRQLLMYSFR